MIQTSLHEGFTQNVLKYQTEMHAKQAKYACLSRVTCQALSCLEVCVAQEYFSRTGFKVRQNICGMRRMKIYAECSDILDQALEELEESYGELLSEEELNL